MIEAHQQEILVHTGRHSGSAGRLREWLEHPLPVTQQLSVLKKDPQTALSIRCQAEHGVRREQVRIGVIIDPERHAVEAHQAIRRAEPQVSVSRLGDRVYSAARVPLFAGPTVVNVLFHQPVRIESMRWRSQYRRTDYCLTLPPVGFVSH